MEKVDLCRVDSETYSSHDKLGSTCRSCRRFNSDQGWSESDGSDIADTFDKPFSIVKLHIARTGVEKVCNLEYDFHLIC